MELGGAERALLGLLEAIDYTEYDVDLFLMRHEGELLSLIPSNVHILPEIKQYSGLAVPMTSVMKRGMYRVIARRVIAKRKAEKYLQKEKIFGENDVSLIYSHKCTLNIMPQINQVEYDVAISFLTPHYFVKEKK